MNSVKDLLANEDVFRFVRWVSKKPVGNNYKTKRTKNTKNRGRRG